MSSIYKRQFWKAAFERAVKATAWTAASTLTAAGTGIIDTAWPGVVSMAVMAGVLSILGSIGSDALTGGTGPSLTDAEQIKR